MARPLRIEIPDGIFHVTSRGTERRAILLDDADRAKWVELLDRVVTRRRWVVLAWTLMDNHFHLFLRTPQPNLSAGMHDLNSGYVSAFNRRHDRCGPLLQGRFKAILVERVRSRLSERLPDRDVPAARELKKAPRVEEIDAAVSRAFAIPAESLHVRGKWHNEARGVAIYLCRKLTGHSIRELGERYGGVGGQAIGRTAILTAQRLRSERRLAKLVRNCEEHLKGEQIES